MALLSCCDFSQFSSWQGDVDSDETVAKVAEKKSSMIGLDFLSSHLIVLEGCSWYVPNGNLYTMRQSGSYASMAFHSR